MNLLSEEIMSGSAHKITRDTFMSQTQLSNFAVAGGLLAFLLAQFGVGLPADKISFILYSLWSLGWTAYSYYQRYQQGDVTLGGMKK